MLSAPRWMCPIRRWASSRQDWLNPRLVSETSAEAGPVADKPVIEIPIRVQERAFVQAQKERQRQLRQPDVRPGDREVAVISCRRSELNHYKNQSYSSYAPLPLASRHWFSRKTTGDFFTVNSFGPSTYKQDFIRSFAELGLDDRVVAAFRAHGFVHPTAFQCQAIPHLLTGEDQLLTSEPGAGKSLAFWANVLQRLDLPARPAPDEPGPAQGSPRIVVITPGRELAWQLYETIRKMAGHLGATTHLEVGLQNYPSAWDSRAPGPTDILVGTLGVLSSKCHRHHWNLSAIQQIILDEADTLIDDTFNHLLVGLLSTLEKHSQTSPQKILCASTFPTNLEQALNAVVSTSTLNEVQSPHLHKVPLHVQQKFIRVPRQGQKEFLLELVQESVARREPLMVFANTSSTCNSIAKYLRSHSVNCVPFSSALKFEERQANWSRFVSGEVDVLVGTDLASRGLDRKGLKHVINFDFPRNMADYIHRLGRVGRPGWGPGNSRVTHFVRGGLATLLTQKIETAIRQQTVLPSVNNNIIRMIKFHADLRQKKAEAGSEARDKFEAYMAEET